MSTRPKDNTGRLKNKLSRELSAQIKEYIRINGLSDGDALFGKGKMSDFVSKLVTEAGVRPAGMRGVASMCFEEFTSAQKCVKVCLRPSALSSLWR